MKITINPLAHARIMYWVKKAGNNEASGMGKVLPWHGGLHVRDVFLLQQKNGPGSTVLDPVDIGKKMFETAEDQGHFGFWWHSHSSMAAFFSGTDYATMEELGSNGWLLSTVFNNRGETKTALRLSEPTHILIDDLTLNIEEYLSLEEQLTLSEEYDAKIEINRPYSWKDGYSKSDDVSDYRFNRRYWKRYWKNLIRRNHGSEESQKQIESGCKEVKDEGYEEKEERSV